MTTERLAPADRAATPALNREGAMLRALLLVGCLAIGLVWVMESRRGELSPWDQWAYPALMLILAGCAVLLTWWPRYSDWARYGAVAAFNMYLLVAMHQTLFGSDGSVDQYQLLTNLYWLPMGYGTAFIFLAMRPALLLSAAVYLATFGVVLWHLQAGDMPHWPAYLSPMMSNLAVAQVIYVVVLLAVSRLRSDYHRSQATMATMREVASTDPLTGLLNRRALADHLAAAHALVRRGSQPMSAILMDVDHFKSINDQKGHAAGDQVLVALSALLAAQLRGSDRVGRWGGEEFLVLAPATRLAAARDLAERIRRAVEAADWPGGRRVTVSLGVAECRPEDSLDGLVQRADQALYAAKAAGRNCVREAAALSPSASSA